MIELVDKYGFPGIAIGGLAWFIMYLMKQHKSERLDWQKSQSELTEDTNKNIRENTSVLSGLKTLLEHRK